MIFFDGLSAINRKICQPFFFQRFAIKLIDIFFQGCFPAVIPRKNTDIEPANKVLNSQTSTPNKAYGKLKDLPNAIWALLTNPTYMMINFGGGADGFCISGLSAFLPKFLQSQYGFSAGIAGAIVGKEFCTNLLFCVYLKEPSV